MKMYARVFCGIGLLSALVTGCARVDISTYNGPGIDMIQRWHVDFRYEPGRYEEIVGSNRGQESKVVKEGHPPIDLQLRDDIFFRLRDRYDIETITDKDAADGYIRIHPVHFAFGWFKSLDIVLLDRAEEILARIRISNGDRNATIRDTKKFAQLSADAVGKVITGKKRD